MSQTTERKKVSLYTDGSCLKNPGKGGYGIILDYNGKTKELSQGYLRTTNNRMELLAVIVGLQALKEACDVDIYTDSKYVANAITERWIINWHKNGWKTANKKDVKNKDLWVTLNKELFKHKANFIWVKGHAGHPQNELCDELARNAANGTDLIEDSGYEEEKKIAYKTAHLLL